MISLRQSEALRSLQCAYDLSTSPLARSSIPLILLKSLGVDIVHQQGIDTRNIASQHIPLNNHQMLMSTLVFIDPPSGAWQPVHTYFDYINDAEDAGTQAFIDVPAKLNLQPHHHHEVLFYLTHRSRHLRGESFLYARRVEPYFFIPRSSITIDLPPYIRRSRRPPRLNLTLGPRLALRGAFLPRRLLAPLRAKRQTMSQRRRLILSHASNDGTSGPSLDGGFIAPVEEVIGAATVGLMPS